MKVVMQRSCVTSVKGVATSLVRGRSYDLPEPVAKSMLASGLAEKAGKRESSNGGSTTQQTAKTADTAKTAETKPKRTRKPRTRKAPSKSQGAAPENK